MQKKKKKLHIDKFMEYNKFGFQDQLFMKKTRKNLHGVLFSQFISLQQTTQKPFPQVRLGET